MGLPPLDRHPSPLLPPNAAQQPSAQHRCYDSWFPHLQPPTRPSCRAAGAAAARFLHLSIAPVSSPFFGITCSSLACFPAPVDFCSIASPPPTSRRRRRGRHCRRRRRCPRRRPPVLVLVASARLLASRRTDPVIPAAAIPRRWAAVTPTANLPLPRPRGHRRRQPVLPRIAPHALNPQLASLPNTGAILADADRCGSPSSSTASHPALRRDGLAC
ncbi:hypothetical protein PCL_07336 [Purpureocillium lilacinum]|uniref:Uncharacterized protein n=1 Tax=Purpureocillium lilacinum TaxID=33203 RepID=A0A2U3DSD8_PURLI|nr:hypothetical protein PCL_07336 [Purpureocillium lilacinum]